MKKYPPTSSGTMPFRGYKTYYEVFGDLSAPKILVALHGGPGFPRQHLLNLSRLADSNTCVVFYDQLGCGDSDRPSDQTLWSVDLFVEELHNLLLFLNLDNVVLLGHSWGGSLASEFVLKYPDMVSKVVLSSPLLDSKLWVSEAKKLINNLPKWAKDAMTVAEENGTTDSEEYAMAYEEFKMRHVCRAVPYPEEMSECEANAGSEVYVSMWGPSETHAIGSLKDWTVIPRLHLIRQPILFLSGKFDEATPLQIETAKAELSNAKWVLFEKSSHTSNLEEPTLYLDVVRAFL